MITTKVYPFSYVIIRESEIVAPLLMSESEDCSIECSTDTELSQPDQVLLASKGSSVGE